MPLPADKNHLGTVLVVEDRSTDDIVHDRRGLARRVVTHRPPHKWAEDMRLLLDAFDLRLPETQAEETPTPGGSDTAVSGLAVLVKSLATMGDWVKDGACGREEPELFFALDFERGDTRTVREQKAKEVCRRCPVLAECGDWVLTHGRTEAGVWGGMTEEERRTIHGLPNGVTAQKAAERVWAWRDTEEGAA